MLVKIDNINLLSNPVKLSAVSSVIEGVSAISTKFLSKQTQEKKGIIIIKSTKRNVFCTLMDTAEKKVKTSCSLRVPSYVNEYNERENLYTRGLLLGNLFGDKAIRLGYTEFAIFLGSGINKGRRGVVRGLSKKGVKITFLYLGTRAPHNGCRPVKVRRKKFRTKPKLSR
uniref:Ribosomal protein S11 n=1 Tax=Saccharina latissima TaxID=309358 RepID=A0A0A7LGD6_SACLA|nr:ribosomal protein S11 [Saccharina latissima]AIZ58361.1 ribosomal protein S11 [Saccharina latissima]